MDDVDPESRGCERKLGGEEGGTAPQQLVVQILREGLEVALGDAAILGVDLFKSSSVERFGRVRICLLCTVLLFTFHEKGAGSYYAPIVMYTSSFLLENNSKTLPFYHSVLDIKQQSQLQSKLMKNGGRSMSKIRKKPSKGLEVYT